MKDAGDFAVACGNCGQILPIVDTWTSERIAPGLEIRVIEHTGLCPQTIPSGLRRRAREEGRLSEATAR